MNRDRSPLLDKITDMLLDTIFVVDESGEIVFVSAGCETLLGYSQQELIGRQVMELVLPEDLERTMAAAGKVMAGRSHVDFENRYLRKDGSVVDIMWSARWSPEDRLRLAVARDITAVKYARRKQNALYEISEAVFNAEDLPTLYSHIHQIMQDLLPSELFLVTTYDAFANALELSYASGIADPLPRSLALAADSPLLHAIRNGSVQQLADTDSKPLLPGIGAHTEYLIAPLMSPRTLVGALVMARLGSSRHYTEMDRDLVQFACSQIAAAIERKQEEAHLHHLATHDPLTNLPNRALFSDRFATALRRAERDGEYLALLYLDLDNFKDINDKYGHDVGDGVLCELARRLAGSVRRSDTVARMGGDEFAVLLVNIRGPDNIDALVAKIQRSLAEPLQVAGHRLRLSASIGTAIYPDQGDSQHQLIRHADGNMYKAKQPIFSHRRAAQPNTEP